MKASDKFAAIYVRVSSEHQGMKASPDEQEADCRRVAQERGLEVVSVYRDIERYRAGRKLVEPSGTRADRPGLLAMLRDAEAGKFGVIIAWKEDRLYRSSKAMVSVLEVVQEQKLEVLLAKETFDPKLAPLKAWVASMELEALKERMTMGVKARLRAGKANTGQDRYGYRRNGEVIEVVEEEAKWVRQVFEWYNARMPINEIRRRLIEAGAPQKGSSIPRKIAWARSSIQAILQAAKAYATGIKIQRRLGEAFEIVTAPIITEEVYRNYLEVRESNVKHPARNVKNDYLVGGLVYCPCNRKWSARSVSSRRRNRRGEMVERKTRGGVYYCPNNHEEFVHPDCPKTIGAKKMDDYIWSKVEEKIYRPEVLLGEARRHIENLKHRSEDRYSEIQRLQSELDKLTMQRQWVITQARYGRISEEDMEYQLGALTFQEAGFKREIAEIGQVIELSALENWEEAMLRYFEDLREGLESLKTAPQTDEGRKEAFELKRQIVRTLVHRVEIGKDREIKVVFAMDVLAILEQYAQNAYQVRAVETYNRIRSTRARRHPGAAYG